MLHHICSVLNVSADWLLGLELKGSNVTAMNSQVSVGGGSIGGDCSKCPLMKAAQKLISKSK